MRVIRDTIGNVTVDGVTVHTNARILFDDQHRLAVFTGKTLEAVYVDSEVSYTIIRKPCACKGDAPRMTFQRVWEQAERAAARAS